MWSIVHFLNEPILVAKIQNYFGVLVKDSNDSKFNNKSVTLNDKRNVKTGNSSSNGNTKLYNGFSSKEKSASDGEETFSSESDAELRDYVITKWIWHYVFVFGTALGDEVFYASFIPFWFWNIDGAVGRRVVLVWAIIMYIGQGIKDIVQWPRPRCPPVVRLQKKWALEYGMPSTHAMVGVSIPFSVILYTMNRYQYSVIFGIFVAVVWCLVICVSRLYLGMHSVLDILVGLLLALLLMIPVVPTVDALDYHLLTSYWSPFVIMGIAVLLIVFYPKGDRWTPTRGDTTMVVSVCAGVHLGAWINYQVGNLQESGASPPYTIIWPSYEMLGLATLRTVIGFCCMIATRALCKSASFATICALLRLNLEELKKSKDSIDNWQKTTVELTYTFVTYLLLGLNTSYLLPNVFRLIGIERPTFYTEI